MIPLALQKLGLDPAAVRAAAEASHKQACADKVSAVLSGKTAPAPTKRHKVRTRKTKTHYLEGEEQRKKQDLLHRNHAHILGLALQGWPVANIATLYGVTDMAIYKRLRPIMDLIRKHKLAQAAAEPRDAAGITKPVSMPAP